MTREQAIEKLKALQGDTDPDAAHMDADKVLCDLLHALEYSDVVLEWEKVKKWYA
jgi:hypothetical protein